MVKKIAYWLPSALIVAALVWVNFLAANMPTTP
jgi:hypothetical protein